MTEKYGAYYRNVGALIDFFLLNISGYIAYLVVDFSLHNHIAYHINFVHILLLNFIWFNATQVSGIYQNMFVKESIPTIKQSITAILIFSTLIFMLVYMAPEFTVSPKLTFWTLIVFSPLFLGAKVVFLLVRRSNRHVLIEYTDIVIVGAGQIGLEFKSVIDGHWGYRLIGFFDDNPNITNADPYKNVPILGKVSDCVAFVKKHRVKEIYCCLPDRALDKITALMREADQEMIRFKLVPNVRNYFRKNVKVKMMGHLPIISPRSEPLESKANQTVKRIFDVVFSLFAVVFIMSWMVPLMAILIKRESKGPVFFKQLRSGKGNVPFYCYKFRSMTVNSDSDNKQAQKNDVRVTKIGAFMRRTSIDELPQFFNVLRGEMSVIGPRPHMLQHTHEYSALIDQFMVRHFLLPGITGWAQVNGYRGETKEEGSMEARVEADIWYMENWSLWLDLKIAFLTVWQVIDGDKNAY